MSGFGGGGPDLFQSVMTHSNKFSHVTSTQGAFAFNQAFEDPVRALPNPPTDHTDHPDVPSVRQLPGCPRISKHTVFACLADCVKQHFPTYSSSNGFT